MGQLLVRCRKCGALYPSGVVMDRKSFESPLKRVLGVTTRCPICKATNLCNKNDMVLQG